MIHMYESHDFFSLTQEMKDNEKETYLAGVFATFSDRDTCKTTAVE